MFLVQSRTAHVKNAFPFLCHPRGLSHRKHRPVFDIVHGLQRNHQVATRSFGDRKANTINVRIAVFGVLPVWWYTREEKDIGQSVTFVSTGPKLKNARMAITAFSSFCGFHVGGTLRHRNLFVDYAAETDIQLILHIFVPREDTWPWTTPVLMKTTM